VHAVHELAVALAARVLDPHGVVGGARDVAQRGAAPQRQPHVRRRPAVTEPAVDRVLGRVERGQRLAALAAAGQVQVDHRPEQPATAVLRVHADPGQARGRQLAAGHGEPGERVRGVVPGERAVVGPGGLDADGALPAQRRGGAQGVVDRRRGREGPEVEVEHRAVVVGGELAEAVAVGERRVDVHASDRRGGDALTASPIPPGNGGRLEPADGRVRGCGHAADGRAG
jgi:hypothetical protein